MKADMENVKIKFLDTAGNVYEAEPLSFSFIRERYTPYTQCSGIIIGDFDVAWIYSAELYYEDKLLHKGMADRVEKKYKDGRWLISFFSRGYTMLLGQNEPEPGIIKNVALGSLISGNTHIPNVTWQATTENVNYIYVKEKSTIWDAICAYAYKAYHSYPYIRSANAVYASVPDENTLFNYNNETIVSMGEQVSTSGMISKVYMCDTDGAYSYSQENSYTQEYDIIREKYYSLDQQWVATPNDGLQAKLNYSNKARNMVYLIYAGHRFENLMDRANYNLNGINFMLSEYISGVEFYGNKNGIFTKVTVYRDSYS